MVGSFGTIIIEAIVIGSIMLWALMDTGKKADEQMGIDMFLPGEMSCPLEFDKGCSDCTHYSACKDKLSSKNNEWEA